MTKSRMPGDSGERGPRARPKDRTGRVRGRRRSGSAPRDGRTGKAPGTGARRPPDGSATKSRMPGMVANAARRPDQRIERAAYRREVAPGLRRVMAGRGGRRERGASPAGQQRHGVPNAGDGGEPGRPGRPTRCSSRVRVRYRSRTCPDREPAGGGAGKPAKSRVVGVIAGRPAPPGLRGRRGRSPRGGSPSARPPPAPGEPGRRRPGRGRGWRRPGRRNSFPRGSAR